MSLPLSPIMPCSLYFVALVNFSLSRLAASIFQQLKSRENQVSILRTLRIVGSREWRGKGCPCPLLSSDIRHPGLSTDGDGSFKAKEVSKFTLIFGYKIFPFKGQQKAKIKTKNNTLFFIVSPCPKWKFSNDDQKQ